MEKKRIDVKTQCFRFTYDPEVLGTPRPVAIQCRWVWGKRGDIAYLRLTADQSLKLYEFLERVLYSRHIDAVREAGGIHVDGDKR